MKYLQMVWLLFKFQEPKCVRRIRDSIWIWIDFDMVQRKWAATMSCAPSASLQDVPVDALRAPKNLLKKEQKRRKNEQQKKCPDYVPGFLVAFSPQK